MMNDLYALADQKIVRNKLLSKSMQSCSQPNLNTCEMNSIRKDGFVCELTEAEKKNSCEKIKTSIKKIRINTIIIRSNVKKKKTW